jgi:hypothetical protein
MCHDRFASRQPADQAWGCRPSAVEHRRAGTLADTKVVFIAFAKEDEATRNLFTGQRIHPRSPFSFTDMSVKEPYSSEWKERVQTRIRRSDGVIALISSSTPKATGQLWEIDCAVSENKPLIGVWIETGYRTKPAQLGNARCIEWSWQGIADFIDSL